MKNKFKKIIIPVCGLGFVFCLGLFFGLKSWNGNLYVQWSPSQGRGVAGADSSKEILNLSSDRLTSSAESILFSQNKIIRQGDLLSFYLKNFLVHDPQFKKHRFICQIFPFVEFSFSALGVSLSGEEGLMLVQSPCNIENENFIGPFWIPYKQILENPSKRSFEISEEETFIRFYHASVVLTPSWLLKSVRFFDSNQEDNELIIRFTPNNQNSYLELNLKNMESVRDSSNF